MFRKVITFLLVLSVPSLGFGASPPSDPGKKTEPEPHILIEAPRPFFPIKEEVKILRAERRRKMPYLDKRHVKEVIQKKSVLARRDFLAREQRGLDEVIGRAIEVYTPVKAAKEKITLAKRRVLVAARELLPGIDFAFELRKGSLSADSFSGKNYHATFRLPVFRGGILWNTFLMEKAQYRAMKKEYDAVLHAVVEDVSRAYFEFNRTREVYEEKQELVKRAEKQHTFSKQKFEQALISEIEYLNVESLAGQLQYDVETAEQELELAKLELESLLDLGVGDAIEVAPLYDVEELIKKAEPKSGAPGGGEGEKVMVLGQSLDEFIDLAYQHRPELQVEAEQLRASRLDELIKRGAFLPRADLTMEFGESAEAFIRNADDPHGFPEWRLSFELSENLFGNRVKYNFDNDENAPSVSQFLQGTGSQVTSRGMQLGVFNGLQDYVDLKDAEVKKIEQIVELEKKEREVIREVKEAYFDYHKAHIQVESTLKRSQYRRKLVELAKIRLEKTEIEISEYLQAELDLSEERKKLHGALADLFKAKSKMNRSIGIRDFLPAEERYGL